MTEGCQQERSLRLLGDPAVADSEVAVCDRRFGETLYCLAFGLCDGVVADTAVLVLVAVRLAPPLVSALPNGSSHCRFRRK
jgi:hypothetical protein